MILRDSFPGIFVLLNNTIDNNNIAVLNQGQRLDPKINHANANIWMLHLQSVSLSVFIPMELSVTLAKYCYSNNPISDNRRFSTLKPRIVLIADRLQLHEVLANLQILVSSQVRQRNLLKYVNVRTLIANQTKNRRDVHQTRLYTEHTRNVYRCNWSTVKTRYYFDIPSISTFHLITRQGIDFQQGILRR